MNPKDYDLDLQNKLYWWWNKTKTLIVTILLVLLCGNVFAQDQWLVTAYCSCSKCCGVYSDGITASGKPVKQGYCAINWLPFGMQLKIKGLGVFTVMDRGAKSLFGDKDNHIKHIDIWFPSHKEAKEFGVKWREVKIRRLL